MIAVSAETQHAADLDRQIREHLAELNRQTEAARAADQASRDR